MPAKRTRPPPRTPEVPVQGSRELDALESLGEAFDEACEHVARSPEHPTARLGPLEELPMASLFPGEFGWQRTLTEDGSPPAGRVLCFLLPGASSDRESPNSPLPGVDRASFSYVVTLSGPPWRILAALSPSGASSGPLREFAEAVARELRSE